MNTKVMIFAVGCLAMVATEPIEQTKLGIPVGSCSDSSGPTYLPDSESCSTFYECSNGIPYKFECPIGLEFNPTFHVCDWPSHAGCNINKTVSVRKPVGKCPAVDSAYPVYFADSESCSIFYECSNGVPYKFDCPAGLHFNPTLNVCDWPSHAGCALKSSRKVAGTCPAVDPAMPVYFPDTESCNIFYECSNGIPYKFSCPAGLEFNPTLHVCDWPSHAGCTAQKKISVRSPVGKCPAVDPAFPVYFADSESCSVFYECSHGTPYKFNCPAGLHFNPTLNVCDWPNHAGCALTSSRKVAGTCPAVDPAMPVYFPDTESCNTFYECSNGTPYQFACPDGLEFNPTLHVCDWPNHAGCTLNKTVRRPVGKCPAEHKDTSFYLPDSVSCRVFYYCSNGRKVAGTCPAVDPAMPVYFPDTESCTVFYECSNGIPYRFDCPAGLYFNPTLNVCDWPNHAGCAVKSSRKVAGTCPAKDPAFPVYFPDTESCTVFYECSNGIPYKFDCPAGLYFNPTLNVCDWPTHAGCAVKSSRKVAGTCPAVDPAFPVYFPDTESCTIFYECSHGIPYKLNCPAGLHFNPTLNVCDWPNHAGCTAQKTIDPIKADEIAQ